MDKLKQHYDIVIAGGGLVGASLALMLAQLKAQRRVSVLVVEKYATSADAQSSSAIANFDARSTALSYGSQQIYQAIGVWSQLAAHSCAIDHIYATQKGAWPQVKLSARQENLPALGYVIENQQLGNCLLETLRANENIHWCAPAQISKIEMYSNGAQLKVKANSDLISLRCQLLIIADGANSPTAQLLGIGQRQQDYQQSAIVANIECSQPHRHVAYERFTAKGPMALLPLSDYVSASDGSLKHRMALVWVLAQQQAQYWLEADESECLQRLQRLFSHRVGSFKGLGSRTSFDLKLSTAAEQVRSSVVVIGNAAHALHPVAGQGFNLSLRDCQQLSWCLQQALNNDRDLGELAVLEDYYQQRQRDQQRTIVLSDRLPKIFNSNKALVRIGRQMGMLSLELMPALRSQFIKLSAGIEDEVL